jgi:hypothetical protein
MVTLTPRPSPLSMERGVSITYTLSIFRERVVAVGDRVRV